MAAAGEGYRRNRRLCLGVTALERLFFKQGEGNEYRVSLRSKGEVDIGAIAKEYGGGGHKNASGCSATGSIAELKRTFREKIVEAIDAAGAK